MPVLICKVQSFICLAGPSIPSKVRADPEELRRMAQRLLGKSERQASAQQYELIHLENAIFD
jgi:hypothetical protein